MSNYRNNISSTMLAFILVTLGFILHPKPAQGQEQQDAQWSFYLAFEDATGAKDSVWFLMDTAATYPWSISGLYGEEPLEPDSVSFQVWFLHPLDMQSGNKYDTWLGKPNFEAYSTELFAENGIMPYIATWDSSLFTADILYEYGDPIHKATLDNEYFFMQNNSIWYNQYYLTLDDHVEMPYFWWGSSNQFPLDINFERGPLGNDVGLEKMKESEFSIFPNPATSHILMSFTKSVNADFRIYNANGMLVKSGDVVGDEMKINLNGFASGLYFVEIQDENGTLVQKFVVDR